MNFKGLLFDLDGTLVDSGAVVDRSWLKWCQKNGLNFDEVSKVLHGRPAIETVRMFLPDASEEIIQAEFQWLSDLESSDVEGVVALPGSIEFINLAVELNIPWAIVTSGTIPVATARIKASGIPDPEILITPELVKRGKPYPDPFLLGAEKLGLDARDCIVFEDAPAGLNAGKAARSMTVAIMSRYTESELPVADDYVNSLADLDMQKTESGFILHRKG
ncbi:phosphatase [Vibrio sp. HA2012]|uniref:HAD-IA family hydrolase n=1 Tax=Vibrio sp. HA2012 TaxID=1971595 RepID=UPI000C2C1B9B|nr:HAD-IA family hydrolase [Vibrio sp. HA2012]PJC86732.1 phosphatase [Vibrio sp. HA2012]